MRILGFRFPSELNLPAVIVANLTNMVFTFIFFNSMIERYFREPTDNEKKILPTGIMNSIFSNTYLFLFTESKFWWQMGLVSLLIWNFLHFSPVYYSGMF